MISNIKSWYRDFREYSAMAYGYDMSNPFSNLSWPFTKWYVYLMICLLEDLENFLESLVCRFKGHDLVDNGYGTPDSGAIIMDCTRCGASWHHRLY